MLQSTPHRFKFPSTTYPIHQNAATSSFTTYEETPASLETSVLCDIFVSIFPLNMLNRIQTLLPLIVCLTCFV